MEIAEILEEIEKIRFHISLLADTIDHERYPVEGLILSKNWSREDINKAHDIFEKWDNILENGGSVQSFEFENDFDRELGINYQGLKSVILAFHRNGQWTNVCESYVDSFGSTPALEYHSIMNRER